MKKLLLLVALGVALHAQPQPQYLYQSSTTAESFGIYASNGTTARVSVLGGGAVQIADLKNTGAATGKKVVCVDTATGQLYASSTGMDCSD